MTRRKAYLVVCLLCIATATWGTYAVRSGSHGQNPNAATMTASPTREHFERLAYEVYAETLTRPEVTAMLGSPGWQGKGPNGNDMAIWESTFGVPPLHDRRYRFNATFSADGRALWSSVTATDNEGGFRQVKVDSNGRNK